MTDWMLAYAERRTAERIGKGVIEQIHRRRLRGELDLPGGWEAARLAIVMHRVGIWPDGRCEA